MIRISKIIFAVLILLFMALLGGAYGYNYFFKSNTNGELKKDLNDVSISKAHLGDLIRERGIVGATAALEKRLDETPNDATILYQLAFVNFMLAGTQNGETRLANNRITQEGVRYMQQAIDFDPDNLGYRVFYATALEEIREDELAVEQFQLLYKNDSFRQMDKYEGLIINYAEALERLGKRKEALQELEKSLAIYKGNPHILSAYNSIKNEDVKTE